MKKSTKRVLACVLGAAMVTGAVTGCGQKAAKTVSEDGRVVISIGNCPSEEINPTSYKTMVSNIERFEKEHPNIKIEMDTWDFDSQSYMAKAEGGTLPTTYYVPLTESKNIMDLGYAADITEEFKKRGFYDNINDFMLDNISRDGKIYFLPSGCYDLGIVMNIELLQQAGYVSEDGTPHEPQTWDELAEMAAKIKKVTGKNGFVLPTTANCGGWLFTPIAWSYGVEFMKKDADGKWQATFDTPECAAALQFVKDLKWKYDVFPANTLIDLPEVQKQMGTGESAITLSAPEQVKEFAKFGIQPDNVGFVRIPAGPKRRVSLMGGGYLVISKDATPEQISAAMDWREFNGVTMELNDSVKASITHEVEELKKLNRIVGIDTLSPWKADSPVQAYRREVYADSANVNMNHIKLYNEKVGVEYQAEEPIAAQALYALLDSCIQEVLTNQNADCAELIHKAAADFQKNQLDYAD